MRLLHVRIFAIDSLISCAPAELVNKLSCHLCASASACIVPAAVGVLLLLQP